MRVQIKIMPRVLLFLLFQSASLAETYYIDPSAKYNGDGTRGTPALSPGRPGAFNAWPQYPRQAGDRYYQKCGTSLTIQWQNGIYFANQDGSPANATIFGAYYLDSQNREVIGVSGEKPIITGLTALEGWNDERNWFYRGNNIWSWEMGSTSPYRLWIDGTERLMAGINPDSEDAAREGIARINPAGSPAIYWCHDTYPPDGGGDSGNTLYVYAVSNPAQSYSSMEGLQTIDRIFTIQDSDHVIFENLDIRAAKTCLLIDRSNEVTIQNCDVGKGANVGILIRGTIVGGAGLTADYGVIKDCIVDSDFHFRGYRYEDQGPSNGIELKDGANFWKIYRNAIKNWGHSGVNIFSVENEAPVMNSNYNKVFENFFTAPEASHCRAFNLTGSASGRCSNNEIYRNYFYKMPTRSQIAADNNKIYYNIFDTMGNEPYYLHNNTWQTSGEGIEIWAGEDNPSCGFNLIYNNVFYNTGEAGIRLKSWGQNQKVHHNEIINNIFYDCGVHAKSGRESYSSVDYAGAAMVIEAWRAEDNDMLSNNIFRNNLIYNAAGGDDVRYKGKNLNFVTFNASDKDDDIIEDNIQSHPQFVDACNGNFALKPVSGAIGKGYNLGEFYANAIAPGRTRRDWPNSILTMPQTIPWDIGAFKSTGQFSLITSTCHVSLSAAYPNPASEISTVVLQAPQPVVIQYKIFDLLGRIVRVAQKAQYASGEHQLVWDGRDDKNEPVPPGIYFIRVLVSNAESPEQVLMSKTEKIVRVR